MNYRARSAKVFCKKSAAQSICCHPPIFAHWSRILLVHCAGKLLIFKLINSTSTKNIFILLAEAQKYLPNQSF